MSVVDKKEDWIPAGTLEALKKEGSKVIRGGIAVFYHEDRVHAVDNRCPHLGFPLHMGSLCDGMLTCHWHHARFDVCSGGTLDPWADDVPSHEVKCIDGNLWVNPQSRSAQNIERYIHRLREGLEQNIGIVIAKAVVGLVEAGYPEKEIARIGIEFGTGFQGGWHSGLTILTAMARILPKLDKAGKILALYQGLLQVAQRSAGRAERYLLVPLPGDTVPQERLSAWYRNCIEVRDTQGAERILLTSIANGASDEQLTDMLLLAVTDHFYLDGGHTIDFHNKAFEALDWALSDRRARVLTSLVPLLASPTRSEELHKWQAPINLVAPLKEAFERLNEPIPEKRKSLDSEEEEEVVRTILGDNPLESISLLSRLLAGGSDPVQLARLAALAAAERIVRFHTQNDFGDWIAVLHTFTHAHAVHEALQRSAHPLVYRAIFYSAVSVYLDRFLNVPSAPRPKVVGQAAPKRTEDLLELLDQRQQVNEAAAWVAGFLQEKGDPSALINTLGHALLREDAEFHSFQMLEAAVSEYEGWEHRTDAFAARAKETLLLAASRYLAAHAPTAREIPHTARIAWRLHRGEKLFEEQ
jgi:nitrite reductase/ring-hydroxylating ferredoxin subunit